MSVDAVLKKLGKMSSTEQSKRESVSVSLSPDECSLILAEVAVLRVQWKGYVDQRDIAREEVVKQRQITDSVLAVIEEVRQGTLDSGLNLNFHYRCPRCKIFTVKDGSCSRCHSVLDKPIPVEG